MIFTKLNFKKVAGFMLMIFGLVLIGTSNVFGFNTDSLGVTLPPVNGDVPFGSGFSLEVLERYYNSLVGGLTFIWGLIVTGFKLNKDKFGEERVKKVIPVVAGGLILVMVIVNLGFATAIQALVSMFGTMGIYAAIKGILEQLGWIGKSDDDKDETGSSPTITAGSGNG